ncbi:hypothetical protein CROQUDRAFT_67346 [Cronartium quercuum f. sp. fusiforme G11]|uniref:cysteine--tRNA ligase n=1 Tax=Cronartium quercuum f. sp. fusiforme G11 TaxID=708437 RepID=A0A9P6NDU8_9BASI|nr:hypothetical protein CROQUDRAFT_67346 [Cronartium quercuum f. sp. fusiforme G11]
MLYHLRLRIQTISTRPYIFTRLFASTMAIESDTPVVLPGLKLYNSLTKSKVNFVPRQPGKVTWYNCGPTVYDASHMGHARNYVAQDILRRIVRDYFGYEVQFVMNVTDIDDKIIERARQQHLLSSLRASADGLSSELVDQVRASFKAFYSKTVGQTVGFDGAYEDIVSRMADGPKWKAEMIAREEKFGMWLDALASAHAALQRASTTLRTQTTTTRADAELLIDGSADVLAKWLDSQYGSTVTDHAIFKNLASKWEQSFFEDMDALGVDRPTTLTRVSEYVEAIVVYIEKIVQRGFAYEREGSVYFDVAAFDGASVPATSTRPAFVHTYAKLQPGSKSNLKLLAEGEGGLADPVRKRSTADFALWKKSKPGEPGWASPWGSGRPGWHIECSVMAGAILGDRMDIHSGGVDLMFPHHDNELAQSEAYHACPQWVNYFLHTGHLHIEGLKMSKSLKNFITIQDALKRHSPRQLRLSFISQRWDLGMDFAESAMAEVRNQEATFINFFAVARALRYEAPDQKETTNDTFKHLYTALDEARAGVHTSFCDSFNTPEAMRVLLGLVAETNKTIAAEIGAVRSAGVGVVVGVAKWVSEILGVLGLRARGADAVGWDAVDETEGAVVGEVMEWSRFRDEVRRVARDQAKGSLENEIRKVCQERRVAAEARNGIFDALLLGAFFERPGQDSMKALMKTLSNPALAPHLTVWYTFWAELYTKQGLTAKDVLGLCDRLRDMDLVELGIALDDQDDGRALVKVLPAKMLIEARDAKVAAVESKRLAQAKAAEAAEAKRLERIMKGKIGAEEMFKLEAGEWSQWDEQGIPTHDKEGVEVSKSRRKKLLKEWEARKKVEVEYRTWVTEQEQQ